MLSVVQRQFQSDRPLAIGEVVDTSGWRLERQLREQGYIRAATDDEIADVKATKKAVAPPTGAQATTRAAAAKKPAAKAKTTRRSGRA